METTLDRIQKQLNGFTNVKQLWFGKRFDLTQFVLPKIEVILREAPDGLDRIPIIGKRAEIYFEEVIKASSSHRIIAKNIQIHRNKITLGELDFLIEEIDSRRKIHVELISKFYLFDPEQSDPIESWVGPNRKDRLTNKLDKLQTKQLPLLYLNETKLVFDEMGLNPMDFHQEVCFKAELFVPRKNLKYPHINNKCIKGFWIKMGEFNTDEFGQSEYFIPEKQDWNLDPGEDVEWRSYTDVYDEISKSLKSGKSPLVWQKVTDGIFHRFFIVFWR